MKTEIIKKTESFLKKLKRAKISYDCLIDCYTALIENDYLIEDEKSILPIKGMEEEYKQMVADAYLKLATTVLAFKDKASTEAQTFLKVIENNFEIDDTLKSLKTIKELDLSNEEKEFMLSAMEEINEFMSLFIKDDNISKNVQKISLHLSKISGKDLFLLRSVFHDSEFAWIIDLDDNINCLKIDGLDEVVSVNDLSNLENSLSNIQEEIDKVKSNFKSSELIETVLEKTKYIAVVSSVLGITICSSVVPEDELTFGITNFEYETSEDFFEVHADTFSHFKLDKKSHSLFWNDHNVFKEIYLDGFEEIGSVPKDEIINPLVVKITFFKK